MGVFLSVVKVTDLSWHLVLDMGGVGMPTILQWEESSW